jgi:hypothetical protein
MGLPSVRIYMLLLRSESFSLLFSPCINSMSRVLTDNLVVAKPLMEPEGSIPCSKELDMSKRN